MMGKMMAGVMGPGLEEEVSPWILGVSLTGIGIALGLFQSPNNSAIMSSVAPEKLGVASAFLATVRNLGWVTGTGLSTTLFAWRYEETDDFVLALHFTLGAAAVAAALAMFAALARRKRKLRT